MFLHAFELFLQESKGFKGWDSFDLGEGGVGKRIDEFFGRLYRHCHAVPSVGVID